MKQSALRARTCAVACLLAPLFVTDALALASSLPGAAAQESVQPQRHVRAQASGARFYNLADTKAEVVANVAGGTPLAVYSEKAGYLEAEPPGGLEVWVFGNYVRRTEKPGLVEITGNNVLMRPLPNSQEKSFPLAQRLDKGDRVRVVGRADESKPIEQDWIRIATPPGTRAWVLASETVPLAPGDNANALWGAAVAQAQSALKTIDLPEAAPASAAGTMVPKSAEGGAAAASAAGANGDALDQAEALMKSALAASEPDYKPARAAYEKVLAATPKGPAADQARTRLNEIALREEYLQIKADAALAEVKRKEELEKADQRLRAATLGADPLWGRFQVRGWLEKAGERWVVKWSGKVVAEIVCTTGRYDLSNFEGFEIGLTGLTVRSAIPASATKEGAPAKLDAKQVEVISGRGRT